MIYPNIADGMYKESDIITIDCLYYIYIYIYISFPTPPKHALARNFIKPHHANSQQLKQLKISAQKLAGQKLRVFFSSPSMGDSRGFFAHGLVTGSITFFVLGVVASMISSTFFVKETTNITKQESIRILVRF